MSPSKGDVSGAAPELVIRDPIHLVTRPWSDRLVLSEAGVRDRPQGHDVRVLGTRLYVLPGFIDAHAHLATSPRLGESGYTQVSRLRRDQVRRRLLDHLGAQSRAGVAGVRDAGASSGVVAELARDRSPDARPYLQAAGRFIAPPRRYPAGVAHEVLGATDLAMFAATEGRRGGGWVKLIGDYLDRDDPTSDPVGEWTQEAIRAAVDAAHSVGARIAIHAMTAAVAQRAIAARVDTLEHGCGLVDGDLALMARLGIAWVPTLAAFIRLRDRVRAGERLLPPAFLEAAVENMRAHLRAASAVGVVLLCGTDGILRHGEVAREVIAFAEAGLPMGAALSAATTAGWSLMGLGEPLRDGGPADALVFKRDPREEPRVLLRPTYVIRAGRLSPGLAR